MERTNVRVRTPRKRLKLGEDEEEKQHDPSNDGEGVREVECDEVEDKKIKLLYVSILAFSTKSSDLNDIGFFLPRGKN
jgi:hypothetical protein